MTSYYDERNGTPVTRKVAKRRYICIYIAALPRLTVARETLKTGNASIAESMRLWEHSMRNGIKMYTIYLFFLLKKLNSRLEYHEEYEKIYNDMTSKCKFYKFLLTKFDLKQ